MMSHGTITQYIDKTIGEYYLHDIDTIALAISGGPDSICLLHAIQSRRTQAHKSLSHLHILTCDHNTRENIQREIDLTESASTGCTFVSFHYEGSDHDEQALRQRRHEQFVQYCKQHNITYLLTGHHLNDRIETTLLNMKRGAGMKGITSITVSDPHFLDTDITILRPLITSSKDDILAYCKHYKLDYALDPTNNDTDYSERNMVRKLIAEHFHTPQFTQSRQTLYDHLDYHCEERSNPLQSPVILTIGKNPVEKQYNQHNISPITSGQRTPDTLYKLYEHYNISINPRSTTLITLSDQLNKRSGNKISYQGLTIIAYKYASVIKLTIE